MLGDPNDFRANSYLAQPGCRIRHSVAQATVTGVVLILTFDTELFDPFEMHDGVNPTRITIRVSGRYYVGANIRFAANAVNRRRVNLVVNGVNSIGNIQLATSPVGPCGINASVLWDFVAGDFIEANAFQDSGGGLNVDSVANIGPEFFAQRVG